MDKSKRLRYEELPFTNNFMFCTILQHNPELCKEIVETILDVRIREIVKPPEREFSIDFSPDGHGIRLDVYFEGDEAVYDIEMQTTSDTNLAKRSRYYQGMIDMAQLGKGEDYGSLKKSYIIFICSFDPFDLGRQVYPFQTICKDDHNLVLKDETTKVFVNIGGSPEVSNSKLKSLLSYLDKGEVSDELTGHMADLLRDAQRNKEWRFKFMTFEWELENQYRKGLNEGIEQGIEQGISIGKEAGINEGRLSSIKLLLKQFSPEKIISFGFPEADVKKVLES